MKRMLTACRRAVWLPYLLVLVTGCAHSIGQGQSSQEYLGMGIVSGTLGEQQRVALCTGAPSSISVVGHVQALEGGAYLIRDAKGQEIRVPHDENTRIDRPAHVGDHIQSW
ncbi:MAG: hypothetical protein HP496_04945, partial [Nitrospira sp.]|nr:hypothetical protein [Nitrospira sp.]